MTVDYHVTKETLLSRNNKIRYKTNLGFIDLNKSGIRRLAFQSSAFGMVKGRKKHLRQNAISA